MVTCPECGVEVADGAAFCQKCGSTMVSDQISSAETAAEDTPDFTPAEASATRKSFDANPDSTAAQRFQAATASRQADDDDDQEIELWRGSFSSKAMVGTWILCGVLTVAAVVIAIVAGLAGIGWSVTGGLVVVLWMGAFLLLLYRQYSVHYRLTNQRFIHEKGLLSRVTDRIEVIDMDDITFAQGVIERMLGVGTIKITSSDRTHPEISLPGIDDVRRVSTLMDDARRKERRRRGLHIEAV